MQLNYHTLGQKIQNIRKSKNISQAALSVMIDKSPGYISYLERGTKVMSLETFVSIANALEVSTDALLNRQLTNAMEISNREVQNIFASCTLYETYVLLDVMQATRDALRTQRHHLVEKDGALP
jgi:transcriptional regulator with XRE-family HTH domain